jgi:hypothetical protein
MNWFYDIPTPPNNTAESMEEVTHHTIAARLYDISIQLLEDYLQRRQFFSSKVVVSTTTWKPLSIHHSKQTGH